MKIFWVTIFISILAIASDAEIIKNLDLLENLELLEDEETLLMLDNEGNSQEENNDED